MEKFFRNKAYQHTHTTEVPERVMRETEKIFQEIFKTETLQMQCRTLI